MIIKLIHEATSPITHMSGTSGNEAILNRESKIYDGEVIQVPLLSGNALRHKMIREPGAVNLIKSLALTKKLTINQVNFLLHGGKLTETSTTDNMKTIVDMRRLFPLYHLLGGSLRNQILEGSMISGRGVLICRENNDVLRDMFPEFEFSKLSSAENFISNYQYTRGSERKHSDLIADKEVFEDKSNAMIFSGQSIIPGSLFVSEIILKEPSEMLLSCVNYCLSNWQSLGGIIGGQSSRGHGKLSTTVYENQLPDTDIYLKHVESVKDESINWLNEQFKEAEKKSKSKKSDENQGELDETD
jgi:CRISPR/Cas system CSM-associated protein Csm3 (group 7 of RAMP superfamily)